MQLSAAKMSAAISGFRHTGIWLLEADFLPAATTDVIFHTAPSKKPSTSTVFQGTEVFFVCLQLKYLQHQAFFVKVPQKSFQFQKLGKTTKE